MRESVYRTDTKEEVNVRTDILFKMPKNIRQIGQEKGRQKLYIEDYVMTFLNEITKRNSMEFQFAILVGNIVYLEKEICVFVSGAVDVDDVELIEESKFSNETWSNIYDRVKKYFPKKEIIGWFVTRPGLPITLDERFKKLHQDNFSGEHKALLLYDGLEMEENFYLSENGELFRQSGYFIYYEKNEQMQEYMIERKNNRGIEEAALDQKMTQMRKIVEDRHNKKKKELSKGIAYSVGTAAAAVILVFGVTWWKQNNERLWTQDKKEAVVQQSPESQEATNILGKTDVWDANPKNEAAKEPEGIQGKPLGNEKQKITTESAEAFSGQQVNSGEDAEPVDEKPSLMEQKYFYTVKEGDTLASISKKMYNSLSGIEQIKEANQLEDADMILAGQVLEIP